MVYVDDAGSFKEEEKKTLFSSISRRVVGDGGARWHTLG